MPDEAGGHAGGLSEAALDALRAIGLRSEAARRLAPGAGASVLRSVVDATVTLFDAEAASIALYDPSSDRLVFQVAAGDQGQGVVGLAVPPDQGLVGYVYTSGQALAISDVRADPRFGRAFAESTQYVPRSIVAVPLTDAHGTIGVLEVLDKRDEAAFSLRDIELASVFARQAAVAISATRVERDVAALIESVISRLMDPPEASVIAEIVAADDRRVGTDRGPHPDPRGPELVLALHVGAGIEHVGEHATGSEERVVADGHALVDGDVVLNLDPVADGHVAVDVDVLTEDAALTDAGAALHVVEEPDLRSRADLDTVVDVGAGMNKWGGAAHGGGDYLKPSDTPRWTRLSMYSPTLLLDGFTALNW